MVSIACISDVGEKGCDAVCRIEGWEAGCQSGMLGMHRKLSCANECDTGLRI